MLDYSSERKIKRIIWAAMVAAAILIILFHICDPWLIAFVTGLLLLSVTLRGMIDMVNWFSENVFTH